MPQRQYGNPHEQLCSKRSGSEGKELSTSIAEDARDWVQAAAGRTTGMTVCAQIAQAARNLGYHEDRWRVRAAWFGQAECWSAKALRKLETRYRAWEAQQARLAAEIDETHAALLRAGAQSLEATNASMARAEAREMRAHALALESSHPWGDDDLG